MNHDQPLEGEVDFGSAVFSELNDELNDELIATVYVGDTVRVYRKNDQVKRDLENCGSFTTALRS